LSKSLNVTGDWSLFRETPKVGTERTGTGPSRLSYQLLSYTGLLNVQSGEGLVRSNREPRIRSYRGESPEKGPSQLKRGPNLGMRQDTGRGCSGRLLKKTAQACDRLNQDCTAIAQDRLLMAQFKTARAQVWKRNGHLMRSVLAIVYTAINSKHPLHISTVPYSPAHTTKR
jgi:hypothetical protein